MRETATKKATQGRTSRKSQIFSMCSCWTSPVQATWFTVCDGRGADNIVEILKDVKGLKNGANPEFLTVDGYTGYDSAARILRQDYGVQLKLTRCLTHLRRPLHRCLKDAGLLAIYNRYLLPRGSCFADFCPNLRKYMEEPGKPGPISEKEHDLLSIYYLINTLFYVDSAIVTRHRFNTQSEEFRTDLQKARMEYSAPVIDALYDAVRLFIINYPMVIKVAPSQNRPNEIKYTPEKKFPEAAGLIYILRNEHQVREILKSPDIELSQSSCERALKSAIVIRKNCQYLHSVDGAQAFADYNTIMGTCTANGVPVLPYTYWLVANMKKRLIELRNSGYDDPTMFQMPHKQKLKTEKTAPDGTTRKTTETIGMYDTRNHVCYDQVDVTGLMPYDYRRYLEEKGEAALKAVGML